MAEKKISPKAPENVDEERGSKTAAARVSKNVLSKKKKSISLKRTKG